VVSTKVGCGRFGGKGNVQRQPSAENWNGGWFVKVSHTGVDRRRLLVAAAAIACPDVPAPVEHAGAAAAETIPLAPSERPRSDIESWNIGIITAHRHELTADENAARDAELRAELQPRFGLLCVRGRYIENYGTSRARPTDERAYLVFGSDDDSGNLKGFLRKCGRRYQRDCVIHKGYYRDVYLHALRDLPGLGMNDGDAKNLGRFHPKKLAILLTLMTRDRASAPGLAVEKSDPDEIDWLGGRWEELGIWRPKSFFCRTERLVVFEEVEAGKQASGVQPGPSATSR
jgi:hypothetical protein